MTISPLNRSLVAVIDILITTGVCNARGLNLMKLPKNPRGSNGFPGNDNQKKYCHILLLF
jgi:hypothetical protein